MKIVEERKALEEGFERLQRIYKEWQRNPSALVRDSLKKYLIECYDHILNLDRIDIDAEILERQIMTSEEQIPEPRTIVTEDAEPKAQEEINETTEIVDSTINDVEEHIDTPASETEEMEPLMESKAEIKLNEDEPVSSGEELNPDEVYLSGAEEREIEEFFKNNFSSEELPKASVEETTEEHSDKAETTIDIEANVEDEVEIKAELQEEEKEEEQLEPIAEEVPEEEVNLENEIQEEIEAELEEEEPEVEETPAKSRWSSFFSKDEPKPYEKSSEETQIEAETQQLTLADKLALDSKEEGIHYEMKEQVVTDLNGAIPIAKKFEFIRGLFADDSANYKTAVTSINEAGDLQRALDITENLGDTYNWSNNEKLAEEFKVFVNRRFAD